DETGTSSSTGGGAITSTLGSTTGGTSSAAATTAQHTDPAAVIIGTQAPATLPPADANPDEDEDNLHMHAQFMEKVSTFSTIVSEWSVVLPCVLLCELLEVESARLSRYYLKMFNIESNPSTSSSGLLLCEWSSCVIW
ncbi:unnamed protein product, partial [Amoebophrya sp. A25]